MNTTSAYRFRAGDGELTRRFRIEVSADQSHRLAMQNVQVRAMRTGSGQAMHVLFSLSRSAEVSVRLVNPAGKVINQVPARMSSAGLNNVVFDARDRLGRAPARGVYLVEILARADDGEQVKALKSQVLR
jgi:hypothetical protein